MPNSDTGCSLILLKNIGILARVSDFHSDLLNSSLLNISLCNSYMALAAQMELRKNYGYLQGIAN